MSKTILVIKEKELADDIYTPDIIDFSEAIDYKYVFKNALNGGHKLPKAINDLIGYGSYFPANQLTDLAGHSDLAMAIGFAKINSDIAMSLGTPIGTRFMCPGFGSNLYSLLFEPYDKILMDAVKTMTIQALTKDVHKIQLITVTVDDSQQMYNLLLIKIAYQIINTPLKGNFVYPWANAPEPINS